MQCTPARSRQLTLRWRQQQFEDYRAVLHAIDAASAQLGDATRGRLGQPGFAID
jgi:hypothetical protein